MNQTMKSFKQRIHIVCFFYLFLLILQNIFLTGICTSFAGTPGIAPSKTLSDQCVQIIEALEEYHFLGKKLDKAMSVQIFDRYIKSLDPTRQLLTMEDMDRFESIKHSFDRYLAKGDLLPAYDIFNLYLERSMARLEYILGLAKTWERDLDFEGNDVILIDNESRAWEKTPGDLYPLWRNELKNHIITMKLDNQENVEITDSLQKIYGNRLKRVVQTNSNDVFQLFMNSVTESFDPHTQYFLPRTSEDFDIHMSLSLEGIGAVLQTEYEYTKVVRLIPKGPADKSLLLMPGDKIIGVGQGQGGEIVDTIGQRIDDVVKLIRGPKDTYVTLKIIPAKKADSTTTISIRRDKVKLEEQAAQKKITTITQGGRDFKIGVIEIPNFYIDFSAYHKGDQDYKSTTKDVQKLLFELKSENIDGLIVDLRDNGGGSLKEANDLTGLFLKAGPTVQIRTKHRITRLYDEDPAIEYTGPLIVLINRMSASASEIFAGAIKDYNRGVIVGSTSFGKGTVQELKPLGEGKLKLTSAKFYRVSGESTQHQGVVPDLEYPQIYKVEYTGESSLDGALIGDRITRTRYNAYRSLEPVYGMLSEKYLQTALGSPGMIYLKKRIELTDELNSQETLSLNLTQRKEKKELHARMELELENQYRTALGKDPLKSFDEEETKLNGYKEILMEQTQWVMADFITLSEKFGYTW